MSWHPFSDQISLHVGQTLQNFPTAWYSMDVAIDYYISRLASKFDENGTVFDKNINKGHFLQSYV